MIRKKYYTGEQIIEVLHGFCNDYDEVLGMLNRFACLETADAEPIRHGEWVHEFGGYVNCSVCNASPLLDGEREYVETPFCPLCGAKMDAVSE